VIKHDISYSTPHENRTASYYQPWINYYIEPRSKYKFSLFINYGPK